MEFRILNRMLEGHDFYEGIRCARSSTRARSRNGNRRRLEDVANGDVDAYFAPLPGGELAL